MYYSSDEDGGLRTPEFVRKGSRMSTSSLGSSSVFIGNISEDVLKVWNQLPEAIRLDPSLAAFQKEYDRRQGRYEIKEMLVFVENVMQIKYMQF